MLTRMQRNAQDADFFKVTSMLPVAQVSAEGAYLPPGEPVDAAKAMEIATNLFRSPVGTALMVARNMTKPPHLGIRGNITGGAMPLP